MSGGKQMFKWTMLFTFLFCTQAITQDIGFEKIGQVRPRHARDIRSSNWSIGAETMDRDFTVYQNWKEYLGPLGIPKARIQAGWAKTEKEQGTYNWAWLDEIVFDMAEQGVEPWMCLSYGNEIYSEGGGVHLGALIPESEEALIAWERWVKAMVARYGHIIEEWEVWNEPNNKNSAEVYSTLLMRTAKAVRSIQPNGKILAMALVGFKRDWAGKVLEPFVKQDQLHLIDVVTFHSYPKNPDGRADLVFGLREFIHSYSPRIKVRMGEAGCPSAYRETRSLNSLPWTETTQTKWALRNLLVYLGRDIPASYFSIIDMKYPDEMNIKGLIKANDDKTVDYLKPSYYAIQAMASIFDDRLERISNYSYKEDVNRSLAFFGYKNKSSDRQVLTLWFDDDIPKDNNQKTLMNFTCYEGNFEDPVYIDLRETKVYEIPDDKWSVHGSVYEFKDIPVYDSPVIVADKSLIMIKQ
ncbi:hypothetical protein GF406_18910 [candidate division KSB1 bacterium]|nr:hypothetical protein [candidate division KSB1 bacterium]